MDFRKIFFVFALLIFGNWGFGQVDSTDFSFTAITDSINIESHDMVIEFEIDSISGYSQLTIELIATDSESGQTVVYSENFEIDALNLSQYFTNGKILIHPAFGFSGYHYCSVFRLTDSAGHQVVINENLQL